MGGKSPEHEISLISGREVVRSLNNKKYQVLPVVVSRNGDRWLMTPAKSLLAFPNPLKLKETRKELITRDSKEVQNLRQAVSDGVDVVFIAMHGPFGEDGTVQGMLELSGIPYTGSGVTASAIGMDKIIFRKIMEAEKIPVPKYMVVGKKDSSTKICQKIKPPYFVKPSSQGSSVGASIAKTKKDLKKSLRLAFNYDENVLVDEYLKGKEVTCAILGNKRPIALPVIEIVPLKAEFFDYESKYAESGALEIVPARISKTLTKKVQDMAVKVYMAIGCRGFARVDFILKDNKYPIVLEINTIPGLTPMSLVPKAAKAAGYSYSQLLDKIIEYAIKK